jgi:hypothetical protein
MSKVFPDFQTFLDTRDGDTIGVTKVTLNSGDAHFNLPTAVDARILVPTYGATVQNFYLNANKNRFSIDGTLGDKVTVVSRHRGSINYSDEGS